jgi:hypothetical protein
MARLASFLVFALLFAIVVAQQPSKPVWPKAFSSTVAVRDWERRGETWIRWFYDEDKQKDRIDGPSFWLGEFEWAIRIFDHRKEKEFAAFFQQGTVACFSTNINGTLPHPTFRDVRYIGQALIDYQKVYHWIEETPDRRFVFQYFDTQDTRLPKRLDFDDRHRGISSRWIFHEFDKGTQDASIFTFPGIINSQCNEVDNEKK